MDEKSSVKIIDNLSMMSGSDLAEYIKYLQNEEKLILQDFEKFLSLCHPGNLGESLEDIKFFNQRLTEIDLAHRDATKHYLSLPKNEKIEFMSNYLPSNYDIGLFDKFLHQSDVAKTKNETDGEISLLAYQSDILKMIATENGYKNLFQLYNILEKNHPSKCSNVLLVLRQGAISQTYFAVRSGSSKSTFVTPDIFLEEAPLPEYAKKMKTAALSIKVDDLEKPTKINTGVELQIHFPFPDKLNELIIKAGYNSETSLPCFIYSPRFVSLHHELRHIVHMFEGVSLEWVNSPKSFNYIYKNMEEFATIQYESILREELGLAPRLTHSGAVYDTKSEFGVDKFVNGYIDAYFRALIEIGVIPEEALDEINLDKSDPIKQLSIMIKHKAIDHEFYNDNFILDYAIKAKYLTKQDVENLSPEQLCRINDSESLEVLNDVANEMHISSHPIIKFALEKELMSVKDVSHLSKSQRDRIYEAKSGQEFAKVVNEVVNEVSIDHSPMIKLAIEKKYISSGDIRKLSKPQRERIYSTDSSEEFAKVVNEVVNEIHIEHEDKMKYAIENGLDIQIAQKMSKEQRELVYKYFDKPEEIINVIKDVTERVVEQHNLQKNSFQ